MWLKLHYNDNGEKVLVNMDNIVNVSNRAREPLDGEIIKDHTVLTSLVSQIHIREPINEVYQMIRSKL